MMIDLTNPAQMFLCSAFVLGTMVWTAYLTEDLNKYGDVNFFNAIGPVAVGLTAICCLLTSLCTMISRLLHS